MGIRDFLFNTEVDDALALNQGQRVRNTEQAIGPVTQDGSKYGLKLRRRSYLE